MHKLLGDKPLSGGGAEAWRGKKYPKLFDNSTSWVLGLLLILGASEFLE